MAKQVIITGGAGFIGSHLCERLLNAGNEVLCVDNFFTGSRQNVAHLLENKNFEILRHDITFPLYVEVDEIYNLACPASPVHYQFNPAQTTKTSVMGGDQHAGGWRNGCAFLFSRRRRVKCMEIRPFTLNPRPTGGGMSTPLGHVHVTMRGKRCAETLFFDYRRQHGLDIKVVRIFNTYGPRMHPNDGRVVSNFIVQALRNEEITVYGDGSQTRSFCYVDDLVDGMMRMMKTEKGFIGPVNLGNPGEFTILELAEMVIAMTGSKSRIVFKPLPEDDPKQRKPAIDLAEEKLGWTPKVQLEDGLKRTIEYFERVLQNE
ncbi:SDR family oxidoreductase [Methanoculleus chikugoensis]|uniref:UDP-glucuronic acid decarboxylase family protein n=1 Tax=Methanoculleus chikugoensis TaxID=118126 RepID=UPI000AED90B2|nr:UDP-glucuronic acid decarboxylase family protein [Methanoculleus chikugoensis]